MSKARALQKASCGTGGQGGFLKEVTSEPRPESRVSVWQAEREKSFLSDRTLLEVQGVTCGTFLLKKLNLNL